MGQEVLVGVERRRRWSDAGKLAIVEEVGIDGLSVSDVARRHDITRQHIYQWRAELRRKTLWSEGDDAGAGFSTQVSRPRLPRKIATFCDAIHFTNCTVQKRGNWRKICLKALLCVIQQSGDVAMLNIARAKMSAGYDSKQGAQDE